MRGATLLPHNIQRHICRHRLRTLQSTRAWHHLRATAVVRLRYIRALKLRVTPDVLVVEFYFGHFHGDGLGRGQDFLNCFRLIR